MPFTHLSKLPEKEILPGFLAKMIHTEKLTLTHVSIEEGAILPLHSHEPEQITILLSGKLEMTLDGEIKVLEAGDFAIIPSGVAHSGKALTSCIAVDIFHPVREDFKKM
ncbi:MAG: cupin domain-containing protein [Bacteroidota bacterium]